MSKFVYSMTPLVFCSTEVTASSMYCHILSCYVIPCHLCLVMPRNVLLRMFAIWNLYVFSIHYSLLLRIKLHTYHQLHPFLTYPVIPHTSLRHPLITGTGRGRLHRSRFEWDLDSYTRVGWNEWRILWTTIIQERCLRAFARAVVLFLKIIITSCMLFSVIFTHWALYVSLFPFSCPMSFLPSLWLSQLLTTLTLSLLLPFRTQPSSWITLVKTAKTVAPPSLSFNSIKSLRSVIVLVCVCSHFLSTSLTPSSLVNLLGHGIYNHPPRL